jgi:hypothetical protein
MRYDVWLNGVSLTSVSEKIYIIDVQEADPKLSIATVDNAKYQGLRMTERTRQSRTVKVTFQVRERDSAARAVILDDIMGWIADGDLCVSYRPNQILRVKWTDLPAVGSALKWADTLSVSFTAYTDPYWVTADHATATGTCLAGVAKTITLAPVGSVPDAYLEFDATASEAVTTLSVAANGWEWTFSALGLAAGDVLRAYYDANGYQRFAKNGVSVYEKRAGDDDILLTARTANTITVTANGGMSFKAKARGRYL